MTIIADLDRDELEEALRLHRPSEIGILTARANVARAKADKAKALWRAWSERTRALAIDARSLGEAEGYKGDAYRDAMSALIAHRGGSLDAERLYMRAETKAQAAERALRRAKGARG